MNTNTNSIPLTCEPPSPPTKATLPPRKAQPLLRSVSLVGKSTFRMIQPVNRRRCTSNEPVPLMKALQANNSADQISNKDGLQPVIHEEYMQDFLRWSHQQTVPLLPEVTPGQPLMPTRVTLRKVPLQDITAAIAKCLEELQEKNVHFSYRPHPDYAGRIEICSTSCKLKFVVQLWRTEDPTEVMVELQRRRGCPIYMHHLRRPLYKALMKLSSADCLPKKMVAAKATCSVKAVKLPALNRRCDRPLVFPPPLRCNFA